MRQVFSESNSYLSNVDDQVSSSYDNVINMHFINSNFVNMNEFNTSVCIVYSFKTI